MPYQLIFVSQSISANSATINVLFETDTPGDTLLPSIFEVEGPPGAVATAAATGILLPPGQGQPLLGDFVQHNIPVTFPGLSPSTDYEWSIEVSRPVVPALDGSFTTPAS